MDDIHSIQAFMPLASLNRLSGNSDNAFNAYLNDRKISIDDTLLINTIDRETIDDHLNHFLDSFQGVFQSVALVAVAFYFTLIYTISKLILEKSERDIASLKIFDFTDGELSRFYLKKHRHRPLFTGTSPRTAKDQKTPHDGRTEKRQRMMSATCNRHLPFQAHKNSDEPWFIAVFFHAHETVN